MKRVYFVRHGESTANAARQYAGQEDVALTELGRSQARKAGQQARTITIDHIISSPLSRAHDTAKIIAEGIEFPLSAIQLNELLVEQYIGTAAGQSYDLDLADFDDVESFEHMQARARRFWEQLQAMPQDNILVVSHGGFAHALLAVVPSPAFEPPADGHIPNAKIFLLY